MTEKMKRCPYCREQILADAIKCKHCGSMLPDSEATVLRPSPPPQAAAPITPPDDATIPLSDGQKILGGRYKIIAELGRGGMGVVHKAHDTKLNIDVAIKLLPIHLAQDARAVEFLKREALASMKLSHPNILRLHHFEEDPENKFLIMEFVDGKNLNQILEGSPNHKLPETEVIRYAIDACKALEYAHQKKVVHRDIKPSNIMVDADGTLKIADFGIARIMKDSHTRHTGTVTSGTLLYMSPEQILGEKSGGYSDIYSLGITLYELLDGEVPFRSGDITHQHLHKKPKPIDGVSGWLNKIILKCLEKKPEDRFQNAGEVLHALESRGAAPVKPKAAAGKPKLVPALVALLVVVVLAGIGYGLYSKMQSPSQEPVPTALLEQPSLIPSTPPEMEVAAAEPLAEEIAPVKEIKPPEAITPPEKSEPVVSPEPAEPAEEKPVEKPKPDPRVTVAQVVNAKVSTEEMRQLAKMAEAEKWAKSLWVAAEKQYHKAVEFDNRNESALAMDAYREATAKYVEAEEAAAKVLQVKNAAENAKNTMNQERTRAEKINAPVHAQKAWQAGEQEKIKADESFGQARFESAAASYENAKMKYIEATDAAKGRLSALEQKKIDKARADEALVETKKAIAEAEERRAPVFAKEFYREAERKLAKGKEQYDAEEFADAARLYNEATAGYRESAAEARKGILGFALRKTIVGAEITKEKYLETVDLAKQKLSGMVLIPAGEFTMGSSAGEGDDDEHPQHRVSLDAFFMDTKEVTVGEYKKFIAETSHRSLPAQVDTYAPGDEYPVVGVSWNDAAAYAAWAGKRLPTEAEWEYACRAGTSTAYNIGNNIGPGSANIKGTGGKDVWEKTAPVGSFGPNAWGLFDMHGNVYEWCADWYDKDFYSQSPSKSPTGPAVVKQDRVIRGGSWDDNVQNLRSADRNSISPIAKNFRVGFRCVRDVEANTE